MECIQARKIMKEYAADEILSNAERLEIEAHISGCPVCKRELLLWQEVLDKQRAIGRMQAGMPRQLKDRIKYRMTKNQNQANLPQLVKKIQSFTKRKGTLITLFVLICVALIFIFRTVNFKSAILGPILFFSGFAIIFLLLLFKGKSNL